MLRRWRRLFRNSWDERWKGTMWIGIGMLLFGFVWPDFRVVLISLVVCAVARIERLEDKHDALIRACKREVEHMIDHHNALIKDHNALLLVTKQHADNYHQFLTWFHVNYKGAIMKDEEKAAFDRWYKEHRDA